MRTCPCGTEVTTTRGRARCDRCRSPRAHYPPGPNARYTHALVVRMPNSLYEKVSAAAAEAGMTLADYVRGALRSYCAVGAEGEQPRAANLKSDNREQA